MKVNRLAVLLAFVMLFAFGCKDDNPTTGNARLQVRLTDAPAQYDAVNIDLRAISIHTSDDENSGWHEIPLLVPGIYNLLDFQNGIDTLLVNQDFASGKITQIRLILGSNSTIVDNGVTYPLETPSAEESGLKVKLNATLVPGVVYRVWIDFDASRSILKTGSGKYKLKPVLRAYSEALGGTIEGTVLPPEAHAAVWAILGTDSTLAFPQADGFFRISGLPESSAWKIWIDANDTTDYLDHEVPGITVTNGSVTTLDPITLEHR